MFKKKKTKIDISSLKIPQHIAIIMDGNGRWAKKRGLPRTSGHTVGAQVFRKIARYCSDIGVKYMTVYAFSTENWSRPGEEVSALMSLFKSYLEEAISDFKDDSIVLRFIGDISKLSPQLQALAAEAEEESAGRSGMVLNIAINYGGRDEIARAAQLLAQQAAKGEIEPQNITSDLITENTYTAGQPDPDFIIRPGGEFRVSNFLLWQSAYSEYIITDKLWPDFKPEDIDEAIAQFVGRNRRFGGVDSK